MNLERTPTLAMTYPPFVRAWSGLTCGVTVALIAVGTLVTTFRVGMADPIWPTAPWHLFLIEWSEPSTGYLVEHTHRLIGWLAGGCILVQTALLWWSSESRWRRWAALGLIAAVSGAVAIGMRLVKIAPVRSLEALWNVGFFVAVVAAIAFVILAAQELRSRAPGRWQRVFVT